MSHKLLVTDLLGLQGDRPFSLVLSEWWVLWGGQRMAELSSAKHGEHVGGATLLKRSICVAWFLDLVPGIQHP